MKRLTKKVSLFFLALAATFLFVTIVPLSNMGIENTSVADAATKISTTKVNVPTGSKYTLKVTGTSKSVKWSTSKSSVATVKNGVVTAKKAGTATITAKVGSKKYTCKVTVLKCKVNSNNVVMTKGKTYTLKVTKPYSKPSFKSKSTSIATVDKKSGKITAKKNGTTVITVTMGKTSFPVNVKVETPSISKSKVTLNKGKTYILKVNNTSRKVTWKSNNTSVATVSSSGKVTAKKNGQAVITAKISDKSYSCTVNVGTATVINCPSTIKVGLGQTLTYKITAGDGFKGTRGKGYYSYSISPTWFYAGDTLTMTITGEVVGNDTLTFTSDGGWKKVINIQVVGTALSASSVSPILNDVTINSVKAYKGVGTTPILNVMGTFTNTCPDKLKQLRVYYTFYDANNNPIDSSYYYVDNPVYGKSYSFTNVYQTRYYTKLKATTSVKITKVTGILIDSLADTMLTNNVAVTIYSNDTPYEFSNMSVQLKYNGKYNNDFYATLSYLATNKNLDYGDGYYMYYYFYDKDKNAVGQTYIKYDFNYNSSSTAGAAVAKSDTMYVDGSLVYGEIASIKCVVSKTSLH